MLILLLISIILVAITLEMEGSLASTIFIISSITLLFCVVGLCIVRFKEVQNESSKPKTEIPMERVNLSHDSKESKILSIELMGLTFSVGDTIYMRNDKKNQLVIDRIWISHNQVRADCGNLGVVLFATGDPNTRFVNYKTK